MKRLTLALLLMAALLAPALSAPAGKVAILVVGPWAKAQSADEVQLLRRVNELLAEVGRPNDKPVRYHFDQPAERKYCEGKLGIKKADLLFVGVVRVDARGAVTQVLDRRPRAQENLEASAQEVVYAWRKRAGVLPAGE